MPAVDVLRGVLVERRGQGRRATVGRLFQKATRKMLEQDVVDIATTAEASPGA